MPSASAAKKKADKKKADAARRDAASGGAPKEPGSGEPSSSQQPGLGASSSGVVTDCQLVLPACLTARQRGVLHEAAGAAGLAHSSRGDGPERHIAIGADDTPRRVQVDAAAVSDDASLCQLLMEHLSLDAAPLFAAPANAGGGVGGGGGGSAGARSAPGAMHGGGRGVPQPPAGGPIDVEAYVRTTRALVNMEKEAEVAQTTEANSQLSPETAQSRGVALLNLRLSDAEGGLLGRTLLTLVSNRGYSGSGPPSVELPAHKFGAHDVVALRPSKGPPGGPPLATGVVYRVREASITVAVEEAPEEGLEQPLRLEKLANEVTYTRLCQTLEVLGRGAEQRPGGPLVGVLFGASPPRFAPRPPAWTPHNGRLDASQQRAVALALAAKNVALVHGPPGTGKTTAVVEIILQEAARGNKVLACAASNIAVDNLVERLVRAMPKLKVVRMGHPARLLPQVLDSSLEAAVLRSDSSALAKDVRKEIKDLNSQLLKLEGWKRAEKRTIRGELRRLAKEERSRQEAAVTEVLKGAQVVCATLTGVLHRHLDDLAFDVCVIDEAAQALEPACWGALLKAPKAVLAGDHLQLPPTIISDKAARAGLSRTLFERLQAMYGDGVSEMLTVQYRMNAAIMQWSSDELYDGKLTAHSSVADHTLAGCAAAAAADAGKGKGSLASASELPVLLLIDTAGCDMEERQEEEGDSKDNPGEAAAVKAHVARLVSAGIPAAAIGIITPYNAQAALLRETLRPTWPALEISSVDGFQGREKEAIVISCVRSNPSGQVGFLADARRMNVAVTRARRHCALVGDSETLGQHPFLARLVDYFSQHGDYASAAELVPNGAGR